MNRSYEPETSFFKGDRREQQRYVEGTPFWKIPDSLPETLQQEDMVKRMFMNPLTGAYELGGDDDDDEAKQRRSRAERAANEEPVYIIEPDDDPNIEPEKG